MIISPHVCGSYNVHNRLLYHTPPQYILVTEKEDMAVLYFPRRPRRLQRGKLRSIFKLQALNEIQFSSKIPHDPVWDFSRPRNLEL